MNNLQTFIHIKLLTNIQNAYNWYLPFGEKIFFETLRNLVLLNRYIKIAHKKKIGKITRQN